ncbi:MAG: hypothetical protein CL878_11545 [Dehalococcoidia bacterium]|nr:hypothetical protein [Dehalococcoidia bacterium]
MAANFATQTLTRTSTISLTLVIQAVVFLAIVGLVIWTVLMTPYGNVHDPFHALRHALYIIPCH